MLKAFSFPLFLLAFGLSSVSYACDYDSRGQRNLSWLFDCFAPVPAILKMKSATPTALLRRAAGFADAELMRSLIKDGAIVDEPDEEGWTALSYAVANDNVAAVEVLLRAGARAYSERIEDSPIVIAAVANATSVLPALLMHYIPVRHINEAYSIAATGGNSGFIAAMTQHLRIEPTALDRLKDLIEANTGSNSAEVDSEAEFLLILTALDYCRKIGAMDKEICITLNPGEDEAVARSLQSKPD